VNLPATGINGRNPGVFSLILFNGVVEVPQPGGDGAAS
jgi:hypothetical protein